MAVSQAETQQEVPACQALLIYDVHVCVIKLQQVCVIRQLLWYICDVVTITLDSALKITLADAGAELVAGEVWQCEEDEYRPKGACKIKKKKKDIF